MSDLNTSSSGATKRQYRPTDYKVKAVLLCDYLNGIPVVDSARRLRAAFGEDTISNECAGYYVKKFKNGNLDIGEPRAAGAEGAAGAEAKPKKPRAKKGEQPAAAAAAPFAPIPAPMLAMPPVEAAGAAATAEAKPKKPRAPRKKKADAPGGEAPIAAKVPKLEPSTAPPMGAAGAEATPPAPAAVAQPKPKKPRMTKKRKAELEAAAAAAQVAQLDASSALLVPKTEPMVHLPAAPAPMAPAAQHTIKVEAVESGYVGAHQLQPLQRAALAPKFEDESDEENDDEEEEDLLPSPHVPAAAVAPPHEQPTDEAWDTPEEGDSDKENASGHSSTEDGEDDDEDAEEEEEW